MLNYAGEKIEFNNCPACDYAEHKFSLPCGMAYENDKFTLSQDWELPIEGFFVVSPKKHIEKFEELDKEGKVEIFEFVDKTIKTLRENNICDRFDVIFEEKENRHFHIWIMPRHKWMSELVGDIIDNVGQVFDYAKANFRTEENFEKISKANEIVRKGFE